MRWSVGQGLGLLGRIAPGYRADLIAVDGSPDQDIGALRDVSFVMVDGRVVKRDGAAVTLQGLR